MSIPPPAKSRRPAARAVPLPQTHVNTLQERTAEGKALRDRCLRSAQAQWKAPDDRADPIELLIQNSIGRDADLLPIRYGRMMANPFAFYRGAAAIMAYDLSYTPATGLKVQACGDCHLLNFGGFATPERKLSFDINDFDETSIAPWEWDVKRLAASFVIAGRANGFAETDNREAALLAVRSYRQHMAQYAQMSVLESWYDFIDLNEVIAANPDKQLRAFYIKKLEKATEQGAREREFAKLAFAAGDTPRILDQPPLIFHPDALLDAEYRANAVKDLQAYKRSLPPERRPIIDRYRSVDMAIKVVGVGSVGTYCGIVLLMSGNGEPLFLQFKQARQSVLEPYAGASPYKHPGQRVVVGQRLMQTASDMFLGWFTGTGKQGLQFYVRQLSDAKIKPVIEIMRPNNLKAYAGLCGRALARAHVRSGDAAVLAGYMGKSSAFEDALVNFASAYADQNEADHAALVKAVRAGRLEARMEV